MFASLLLAMLLLLVNVMSNIPLLVSMEWTALSITVAVMLSDMRCTYVNCCTLSLVLASIWMLQILIAHTISSHPITVASVLNICVSSLIKSTQCTIAHIMRPEYCLQMQAARNMAISQRVVKPHVWGGGRSSAATSAATKTVPEHTINNTLGNRNVKSESILPDITEKSMLWYFCCNWDWYCAVHVQTYLTMYYLRNQADCMTIDRMPFRFCEKLVAILKTALIAKYISCKIHKQGGGCYVFGFVMIYWLNCLNTAYAQSKVLPMVYKSWNKKPKCKNTAVIGRTSIFEKLKRIIQMVFVRRRLI
jgi:hypothetical protein